MDIYIVVMKDNRDILAGEVCAVFVDLYKLAQYNFEPFMGDDKYCYFVVEHWQENNFVGSFSIPEIIDLEE